MNLDMNVAHPRYFALVAENASFRRAAMALSVQQSSASRGVRQLEGELSVDFRSGSAEGERLFLSNDQLCNPLLKDTEKREQAAAEYDRLGEAEAADALRAEVMMAKRYVED
jgi:hypothetical protein